MIWLLLIFVFHLCSYLFSKVPIFLKVSGLKHHNILRRKHKWKMKISGNGVHSPSDQHVVSHSEAGGAGLSAASCWLGLGAVLISPVHFPVDVPGTTRLLSEWGSPKRWGAWTPGIISKQRVQLLTQHWPWSVPAAGHSIQFTFSALLRIVWVANGKDVVSECKDFDNIVRTIEIHTGNYNARHNVENPTTDVQSGGWNKAVWGSGFGVTQAWDTRCHQCE